MEQRAVTRFLTLKDLRASAMAAELKPADETEAFALSTIKKWCKRSAEGRTRAPQYNNPRYGRPLTNDLADAIAFMLKERSYLSYKVLCQHFRTANGTWL
jgi:hypothetical protein